MQISGVFGWTSPASGVERFAHPASATRSIEMAATAIAQPVSCCCGCTSRSASRNSAATPMVAAAPALPWLSTSCRHSRAMSCGVAMDSAVVMVFPRSVPRVVPDVLRDVLPVLVRRYSRMHARRSRPLGYGAPGAVRMPRARAACAYDNRSCARIANRGGSSKRDVCRRYISCGHRGGAATPRNSLLQCNKTGSTTCFDANDEPPGALDACRSFRAVCTEFARTGPDACRWAARVPSSKRSAFRTRRVAKPANTGQTPCSPDPWRCVRPSGRDDTTCRHTEFHHTEMP